MAWDFYPKVAGEFKIQDETEGDIYELIQGINERCTVLGVSTISTDVNAGDFFGRNIILEMQSKMNAIIPRFWDTGRNQFYTRANLFTDQGIGDAGFWSGPAAFSFGKIRDVNEIYSALNGLTKIVIGHSLMYKNIRAYTSPATSYDNEASDKYSDDRSSFLSSFSGGSGNNFNTPSYPFEMQTTESTSHSHSPNFQNSLQNSIDDSQTSFVMSLSIDSWPGSGTIRVENEIINFGSKDNATRTLSGCTRGASGSTAASHASGSAAFICGSLYFHQSSTFTKDTRRGTVKFATSIIGGLTINSASIVFANQRDGASSFPNRTGRLCSASGNIFEFSTSIGTFNVIGSDSSLHDQNISLTGITGDSDVYIGFKWNDDVTGSFIGIDENEGAGLTFSGVPFSVNGTFVDTHTDLKCFIQASSYFAGLGGAHAFDDKIALILDIQFSKRT